MGAVLFCLTIIGSLYLYTSKLRGEPTTRTKLATVFHEAAYDFNALTCLWALARGRAGTHAGVSKAHGWPEALYVGGRAAWGWAEKIMAAVGAALTMLTFLWVVVQNSRDVPGLRCVCVYVCVHVCVCVLFAGERKCVCMCL